MIVQTFGLFFFFSSRRRHTRCGRDWSSDVCSSDLDRLGIPTKEVLEAAATKWNFLPFTPGLVGGHCIGVDPYYLTARAEAAGYYPQVILSGRRINDGMGGFIAQRLVKLLIAAERPVKSARIGIVGIAFKEDVPDIRNSRVPDIVTELQEFGITALVADGGWDKLFAALAPGGVLVDVKSVVTRDRVPPGIHYWSL